MGLSVPGDQNRGEAERPGSVNAHDRWALVLRQPRHALTLGPPSLFSPEQLVPWI